MCRWRKTVIDMEPHYYLALEVNREGDTSPEQLVAIPYNKLTLQLGASYHVHMHSIAKRTSPAEDAPVSSRAVYPSR